MTQVDHQAEAESYLRSLDSLDAADAYVAVIAAQAHSQLAALEPARRMVDLQQQLLTSMLPTPPSNEEQVKAAIEEAQALARAMPGPEDQVKPVIEEPQEFGSIVRAGYPSQPRGTAYPLWQRSPMNGKHYWESETGAVEVWPELTDVEVLRVGLGEVREVDVILETERTGAAIMAGRIHNRLQKLLDDAITSERKNALEKAIQAVEELAP